MGGPKNQPLNPVTDTEHDEFHNDLNQYLKTVEDEDGNNMMPVKGNPGWKVIDNFGKQNIEDALGKFYRGPMGDKYPDAAKNFFKTAPNQTEEAIRQSEQAAAEEASTATTEAEALDVVVETAEAAEVVAVIVK